MSFSMSKTTILLIVSTLLAVVGQMRAQELKVETLIENIQASGGITIDASGNLYVSDFGRTFPDSSPTKVYKVHYGSWKVDIFADGFMGASGSLMSRSGVFYQSNPKGHQISKVLPSGEIVYDFAVDKIKTPVGIVENSRGELLVANCGNNNILKVAPDGSTEIFSSGEEYYSCPNGLTLIPGDTLVTVNFGSDKIVKIAPDGSAQVLAVGFPILSGGPNPVGLGHITWSNGWLFATAIGRGYIYRIDPVDGTYEVIAGDGQFKNTDGPAMEASFSKPNGIAASATGDTLYVNVSDPTWANNPLALHPAHLKMITGVCSLPDSGCK